MLWFWDNISLAVLFPAIQAHSSFVIPNTYSSLLLSLQPWMQGIDLPNTVVYCNLPPSLQLPDDKQGLPKTCINAWGSTHCDSSSWSRTLDQLFSLFNIRERNRNYSQDRPIPDPQLYLSSSAHLLILWFLTWLTQSLHISSVSDFLNPSPNATALHPGNPNPQSSSRSAHICPGCYSFIGLPFQERWFSMNRTNLPVFRPAWFRCWHNPGTKLATKIR